MPPSDRSVTEISTVSAQSLVDGVVDDLPQAVHQAAGIGRADVHGRPLADRFQPFQDEQVVCLVIACFRCRLAVGTGSTSVPRILDGRDCIQMVLAGK